MSCVPPRARTSLLTLAALLWCFHLCLCPGTVSAHVGYYNTAVHAHDIDTARQLAAREHKRIFVSVTAPARDGWQVFRWPDASTQALVDLLVRETVIVELTTDRAGIQLPGRDPADEALVLLSSAGEVLREFPIDAPPVALHRALEAEFSSDAAIARIRRALEDLGPAHFVSRERLAHALRAAGRTEAALAEYRVCMHEAIASQSRAAEARRTRAWAGLALLARESVEAQDFLEATRASATARVLAQPDERKLAHDLGRLNAVLGDSRANASLFDRLPHSARARHGLVDSLVTDLVAQRRYDEILRLVDPIPAWEGEVAIYRRNRILRPASAQSGRGRGTRAFVVERGLALAEALAGQGDRERSRTLFRALIEFDPSPELRWRLREAALRTGRADLLSPDVVNGPRVREAPR